MLKQYLTEKLENYWYNSGSCTLLCRLLCFGLLWPLAQGYKLIIYVRRWLFKLRLLTVRSFKVPIIIVGNISVGGTGKTPVVIYLVELLRRHGLQPGVVSSGYKRLSPKSEILGRGCSVAVTAASNPAVVGDEPVLIAARTGCPVVVDRQRVRAVEFLLSHNPAVNIVICDDGLQHYALERDIEIAVVDGARKFGNGYCLPAGPLREDSRRLEEVNFILINCQKSYEQSAAQQEKHSSVQGSGNIAVHGVTQITSEARGATFFMRFKPGRLYNLNSETQTCALTDFVGKTVYAVAGIGNPDKFFTGLTNAGLQVISHAFPDHHNFVAQDLVGMDNYPVIMTEKDAVKCRQFMRGSNCWVLPVTAEIAGEFESDLLAAMRYKKLGG